MSTGLTGNRVRRLLTVATTTALLAGGWSLPAIESAHAAEGAAGSLLCFGHRATIVARCQIGRASCRERV